MLFLYRFMVLFMVVCAIVKGDYLNPYRLLMISLFIIILTLKKQEANDYFI